MAFEKISDQGLLRERGQLERARDLPGEDSRGNQTVKLFVHGWHINALAWHTRQRLTLSVRHFARPFDTKKPRLSPRTLILIAAAALSACSGLEPGRLDLDDLSSLKPSRTAYDTVISRCGPPLREETSGGEIRATYAVEQEAASLSNIDGKGFVRGGGGFVTTYPVGSRDV